MAASRRRAVGCAAGVLAAAALTMASAPASAVNHPFGSHPVPYAAGSILPAGGQAALDQAVRDFYDAWKQHFVTSACGAGRYVVLSHVSPGNLTVSEAHGYGMVLMALMAGHDPDARAIFDGMFSYFREHPSDITPQLMAWKQRKSCGDSEGADTASDGDLDIAYALLLADKQWGSCGPINYAAEAANVLAGLRAGDTDTSGHYVLLGDWTTPSDTQYYPSTRSSDFMPDHLRAFASATGSSVWTDVLDRTYQMFDTLQTGFSPSAGLIPDFIADPLGSPHPVGANFLEGPNDGAYDYNACRDPWRVATDYLVAGDARAKTIAQRLTTFFRGVSGDDPVNIDSGYQLDGSVSPGADYQSMAFIAPLGVGAMTDSANQAWLNAIWNLAVATSIDVDGYYENTLKLLSMIVMSGNWWTPQSLAGGCEPPPSTPICSGFGSMSSLQVKLSGIGTGAGRQGLTLTGSLFFPGGIPAAPPYSNGAQLLLEDAGNGNATVYEVSHFTTAVPPASAAACASGDGWTATASRTQYRNRSTEMDPPTCTAGTSNGLAQLQYRPRGSTDLDVQIKATKTTLPAPVGPLRATLVLGSTQGAGDSGQCAISTAVPCSGSGSTRRCR